MERAAKRLEGGPLGTLELAREVLWLRGHPGAASAAVFALLGTDARFQVDGDGRWSLREGAPGVGPRLERLRYAVVDVETTGGGYGRGHRITEVAVVGIEDGVITEEYRTLVNPGRPIPRGVRALTGIDDGMVVRAPWFDEIAEDVLERLRGRVFVAHNAGFDWGFLTAQLADAVGQVPVVERLCTVRMARRLLPRLRRRNLDALSDHYGVEIHGRHRAWGDALATARVFLRLLDEARRRGANDLASLQALLRRRRRRDDAQTRLPLEEARRT